MEIPDNDPQVSLSIHPVVGVEHVPAGGWYLLDGPDPVDLSFMSSIPSTAISSVTLSPLITGSLAAMVHLSPGLRRLYLSMTGLDDDVLPVVAQLTGLTYLQSWGNRFTDHGVQQLVTLQKLESLYLEEETLTVAGFAFTQYLPRLTRLGLQDVPLSDVDLARLRTQLPDVSI